MSKQQSKLIEALRNLSKEKATIIPAQVEESNKETGTIDVVTFEGVHVYDVRLRSVIDEDGKGVLIFPVKGSSVLMARTPTQNRIIASLLAGFAARPRRPSLRRRTSAGLAGRAPAVERAVRLGRRAAGDRCRTRQRRR